MPLLQQLQQSVTRFLGLDIPNVKLQPKLDRDLTTVPSNNTHRKLDNSFPLIIEQESAKFHEHVQNQPNAFRRFIASLGISTPTLFEIYVGIMASPLISRYYENQAMIKESNSSIINYFFNYFSIGSLIAIPLVIIGLGLIVFGVKGIPPIPIPFNGTNIPLNVLGLSCIKYLKKSGKLNNTPLFKQLIGLGLLKQSTLFAGLNGGVVGLAVHWINTIGGWEAAIKIWATEFLQSFIYFYPAITLAKGDNPFNGSALILLESIAAATGSGLISAFWGNSIFVGYIRSSYYGVINLSTGLHPDSSSMTWQQATFEFVKYVSVIVCGMTIYHYVLENKISDFLSSIRQKNQLNRLD